MNSLKYGASFAAVALLLCATAFSKDSNSGSFDLSEPATVGSTVLQPGHYKVQWTGTEKDVKVSVLQKGKTIATSDATIEQLPSKATADAVSLKIQQDNTKRVDEIEFDNRSQALVFPGM
jgi:hypothetical protein